MTDKELQELSNKVRMAIELEAPKARFITFFFTGEPEDKNSVAYVHQSAKP